MKFSDIYRKRIPDIPVYDAEFHIRTSFSEDLLVSLIHTKQLTSHTVHVLDHLIEEIKMMRDKVIDEGVEPDGEIVRTEELLRGITG